jgi:aspartokinase
MNGRGRRPPVVVRPRFGVTDRLIATARWRKKATAIARREVSTIARAASRGRAWCPAAMVTRRRRGRPEDFARHRSCRSRCCAGVATSLDALVAAGRARERHIAAALRRAGFSQWVMPARHDHRCGHTGAAPQMAETAQPPGARPRRGERPVAVLGGFIGATVQATTTLGRGGSDYSAAIVGAPGVDEIQIWTDVDGMLTADHGHAAAAAGEGCRSRKRPNRRFGAKVLHPSTILPPAKNIPADPELGVELTTNRRRRAPPRTATAIGKRRTVIDIT